MVGWAPITLVLCAAEKSKDGSWMMDCFMIVWAYGWCVPSLLPVKGWSFRGKLKTWSLASFPYEWKASFTSIASKLSLSLVTHPKTLDHQLLWGQLGVINHNTLCSTEVSTDPRSRSRCHQPIDHHQPSEAVRWSLNLELCVLFPIFSHHGNDLANKGTWHVLSRWCMYVCMYVRR